MTQHQMTDSSASGQRCLYCGAEYPLYPPILFGCPQCEMEDFKAPLEIVYDYPAGTDWMPSAPLPDITRYARLLPPLAKAVSMGEGGTPLVRYHANIEGDY